MVKALDIDKGFDNFWMHLLDGVWGPFSISRDTDELRELLRNAYTDGFYAGRDYEAELAEEGEDD